jgi:Ca-activated chloride channel family protein
MTMGRTTKLATLAIIIAATGTSFPAPALAGPSDTAGRLRGRSADGKSVVDFPLQRTSVRAEVSGTMAHVEVQQVYLNPSSVKLEAVYAFPLPVDAAVHAMSFRIGRRLVYGVVKEREEARQIYEVAKREGKVAALLDEERDNLFTQSLANVPPGEKVVVTLRYVHELAYEHGTMELTFPTTVGPRYIPGAAIPPAHDSGRGWSPDTDRVPDGSRVSPPVVPPGFRSGHDLSLIVRILSDVDVFRVSSPTHRVLKEREGNGVLARIAADDAIPNKDFVLRWQVARERVGFEVAAHKTDGEGFVSLTFQPPRAPTDEQVAPRELVFVLDCSGSMGGDPMERSKAVVRRALLGARPGDTFQIIRFSEAASGLGPKALPATEANIERALEHLDGLSGWGGTDMVEGVRAALGAPPDPQRLRIVMFLTDGYIGNEGEILAEVRRLLGEARLFSLGVGSSVNRFLLERLALVGRGAVSYALPNEAVEPTVERFYRRIDAPVLTDVRVEWLGVDVLDPVPNRLPDLFAGQPLVVVGRYQSPGKGFARVSGRLGGRPFERSVPIRLPARSTDHKALKVLWARREVARLSMLDPEEPSPDVHERIVDIGTRYQIATRYTSFVAVEQRIRADLSLPLHTVLVPNEMPAGVSFASIFATARPTPTVTPSRVKPGDPEVRVTAEPGSTVVVRLPWGPSREAIALPKEPGVFVTRFLVPATAPDGSYEARIEIMAPGGEIERRSAPFTVDTSPPILMAIGQPVEVAPGGRVTVRLKPTVDVVSLAAALLDGRSAHSLVADLKSEADVRRVWILTSEGEEVEALPAGDAMGFYTASFRVPAEALPGELELDVAAVDLAGNVGRSKIRLRVLAPGRGPWSAAEGTTLLLVLGLLLLASGLWALRRRRA